MTMFAEGSDLVALYDSGIQIMKANKESVCLMHYPLDPPLIQVYIPIPVLSLYVQCDSLGNSHIGVVSTHIFQQQ